MSRIPVENLVPQLWLNFWPKIVSPNFKSNLPETFSTQKFGIVVGNRDLFWTRKNIPQSFIGFLWIIHKGIMQSVGIDISAELASLDHFDVVYFFSALWRFAEKVF